LKLGSLLFVAVFAVCALVVSKYATVPALAMQGYAVVWGLGSLAILALGALFAPAERRGLSGAAALSGHQPRALWYRDRGFWRPFFRRFLPAIAVANLLWEVAQLPLYTLWAEAPRGFAAYAVLHCTVGDILIAGSALLAAMCLAAPRGFPRRGLARVAVAATLLGLGYTVFSEWLNTAVRDSWAYAPAMPIVPLLGVGLTPFLQWLVLPPLVLYAAFRRPAARRPTPAGASR